MSFIFASILLTLLPFYSWAQLHPRSAPHITEYQSIRMSLEGRRELDSILHENNNGLPNIVLIGYWPPTNEMMREFSPHALQNPEGWKGKNWEARGYNIYSFFPEFPQALARGEGDFEVDYQDTSSDFWTIIPKMRPVVLLSFGRASRNHNWEIEAVTRNLSRWIADYKMPLYPFPSPPDAGLDPGQSRYSVFPSDSIVAALAQNFPDLNVFVSSNGAGGFLCEYLGFHLSWFRDLYPEQVRFAAHTHIGSATPEAELRKALKLSLRTLIDELKTRTFSPARDAYSLDDSEKRSRP